MPLRDAALPIVTIIILSPLGVLCFRNGVPIEIIVFGLLLAGYKSHQLFRRGHPGAAAFGESSALGRGPSGVLEPGAEPSELASGATGTDESELGRGRGSRSSGPASGFASWRSKIPWRSQGTAGDWRRGKTDSEESWRSKASSDPKTRKPRLEEQLKPSALSQIKKNTSHVQWRSIINKFTPEKFDKLCEQLLGTLPTEAERGASVSDDEFKQVLEDLLALIFEATSRQHRYTEMYTDLCQKILGFVAKQRPELDGKSCIWEKCQHIFQTMVLKTPEIPMDLPEDEYMDRKVKLKEKMVGMVKFGGDLVSRGLVPCDGVMQWIHTLLSEKTQEVYSIDPDACDGELEEGAVHEKDLEQREVQLEVLCAILASMGSSLSDNNTWSDENRLVIEDVFMQLEQLSMDTENLSLRIRCLIRDILDLRMAHWKEKEGKLKPAMLQRRKDADAADEQVEGGSGLREDAPEFVPGSKSAWTSDRINSEGKPWLDPQLLGSLQAIEHHLEVIEDRDLKLQRLKALIQLYHLIQEQQIVIVANSGNVKRVLDLIGESFKDIRFLALDFNTPEAIRKKGIKSFEIGETSILVLASEVSTRRDFDFGKPASVLINFDFPMTLQLYLYRIYKRADSSTHVYTFFSPKVDVRHAVALVVAMDGAKQKIPPGLQKLKDRIKSEDSSGEKRGGGGDRGGGGARGRTPKASESKAEPSQEAKAGRGGSGGGGGQAAGPGGPEAAAARQEDRPASGHVSSGHEAQGPPSRSYPSREGPNEGARSNKSRASAGWREDGGTPSTPSSMRQGDDSRRRDFLRKPEEPAEASSESRDTGGWQRPRGLGNRRAVGSSSRGGQPGQPGAEERLQPSQPEDASSRQERAPWFDQGLETQRDGDSKRTPAAANSTTSASSVGASTMRQRRHDGVSGESSVSGQSSSAGRESRMRAQVPQGMGLGNTDLHGDAGRDPLSADKERRYIGSDKQRDVPSHGGGCSPTSMPSRGWRAPI